MNNEALEKELQFLKESLEAGVITQEEYDRGEERIQQELQQIHEDESMKGEENKELSSYQSEKEQEQPSEEEDETIEEPQKEEQREEKPESEEESEREQEIAEEGKAAVEEKKEAKRKIVRRKAAESAEEQPVFVNKKVMLVVGIIALIIVTILIFKVPTGSTPAPVTEVLPPPLRPLCTSDSDCAKEGKVGICQSPNTAEATCLFKEPIPVAVTIVNDRTCASCDTERMISVLESLFVDISVTIVDRSSTEGKTLINSLDITALPAYILNGSVADAVRFDKFQRALIKKDSAYLVTDAASGAPYFFARPEKPATLELFTTTNDNTTEKNVQEVLGLFGSKITYKKYIVGEQEGLQQELAIATYPTFLVNNKLKFSGAQPANTIKEKICELNDFRECNTLLSRDIIK